MNNIFLPLFLLLCSVTIQGQSTIVMPDGTISEDELSDLKLVGKNGENELFFSEETQYIHIAIKSEELYVASLCLCAEDEVMILHASAALGKLVYVEGADGNWRSKEEKFVFGMRSPELDDAAIAERQAYLETHGWVANTAHMGKPGETEFIIDRKLFNDSKEIRIALGLMPASDPEQIIDFPEGRAPGCADHNLVAGPPEPSYIFRPDEWFVVQLGL